MADTIIYSKSDLQLNFSVFDEGAATSTSLFSAATYKIVDRRGVDLLTKTLGAGITRNGTVFEVLVTELDLPFSGVFIHQLTVTNLVGDALPPVFQDKITVIERH
jgi:hypothetical protein